MTEIMKGITCCADCAYYNMKKHKCARATDEGKPTDHFYADCPLPTVTEAQGWISVKDRLPENDRFVLVCNDDGHMLVAQYIEETAQWQYKYINYDVDVWDDEEQGPVCWWAELPEPPKEEKDDDE